MTHLKDLRRDPEQVDDLATLPDQRRRPLHFGSFAHVVTQQEIAEVGRARGQDESVAVELGAAHVNRQIGEQRFLNAMCGFG